MHRLESNAEQTITTMHLTCEQTCRDTAGSPLGRLTGEWWIVNGTSGAPFPAPVVSPG